MKPALILTATPRGPEQRPLNASDAPAMRHALEKRVTPAQVGDVVLRVELTAVGMIVAATGFAMVAIFGGG